MKQEEGEEEEEGGMGREKMGERSGDGCLVFCAVCKIIENVQELLDWG